MTAPGIASVAVRSERSIRAVPALSSLTPRQSEALRAYAATGNYTLAAERTTMTMQTFKNHMSDAYKALGVVSAIDAFRVLGWLDSDRGPTAAAQVADLEARLAAIHADSGALLAELRREAA